MAATYFDPDHSDSDAVRFLIGDTNTDDAQLQDAEIAWLLAQASASVYQAAIAACRALAFKYSRLVSSSVGDTSIQAGDLSQKYMDLIPVLEAQSALTSPIGAPFTGGVSRTDVYLREDDTDRIEPFIAREERDPRRSQFEGAR
jgi:hypothetical protein